MFTGPALKANVLFMYLSVRKVRIKELSTLNCHCDFNTVNHWARAGVAGEKDRPEWTGKLKDIQKNCDEVGKETFQAGCLVLSGSSISSRPPPVSCMHHTNSAL
ncbi:MAG: hypothetical protein ACYSYL_15265, partial [Planctomycetota bacterium]